MGKLIRVLTTAILSVIGGLISIVTLDTGFLAFLKTPGDPTAYIPCASFLFAVLMTFMSLQAHFNKDTAYIKKTVDDIKDGVEAVHDQAIENRTITEAKSAQTLLAIEALEQKIDNLSDDAKQSFTEQINELLASHDKRKAPAQKAYREGRAKDAADHLQKIYKQESAAADEFAQNTANTAREAGWLYSLFNVQEAITAFEAAVKYNANNQTSNSFSDYLQLARLYMQAGISGAAAKASQSAFKTAKTPHEKSLALDEQGDVATAQGDLKAARQYFTDGLAIAKKLADDDISNAGYQRDLSVSYNKLGDVATAQGDLKAARQYFTDGLAIAKKLADDDISNAGYQRDVGVSHFKLAGLDGEDAQGHWNAAYDVFKALDEAGKLLPADKAGLEMLREKADIK